MGDQKSMPGFELLGVGREVGDAQILPDIAPAAGSPVLDQIVGWLGRVVG